MVIALNTPNNIGIHDDIGGTVALTNFTFAVSNYYDFRITDDGSNITLYFNDQPTPLLTLASTNRQGGVTNLIDMENSRGNCGGGNGTDGAGILVTSLAVTELLPTLNIYTAIELNFLASTNRVYQVQASPDLTNWTNFGPQIQGNGSLWDNTYSTRGQTQLYYRVQVVQ